MTKNKVLKLTDFQEDSIVCAIHTQIDALSKDERASENDADWEEVQFEIKNLKTILKKLKRG